MNKKGRPRTTAGSRASGSDVGRDGLRLLAALGEPGAYAFPDPIEDAMLIVRAGGDGVSIGRGRFRAEAGARLMATDLADREPGPAARLRITTAGRARLRRMQGPDACEFLAQHLDLAVDAPGHPMRDASESPIAWMARRRGRDGAPLLEPAAVEAGERLRRDLTAAAMLPRMGVDWTAPRVDGAGPRDGAASTDTALAAKTRVRAALAAVGSDLSGLLLDLCGHLKGLERIEAERGWPARSAKVVSRLALGRLAEHYGLEREARGPDRGRLRLWRAAR